MKFNNKLFSYIKDYSEKKSIVKIEIEDADLLMDVLKRYLLVTLMASSLSMATVPVVTSCMETKTLLDSGVSPNLAISKGMFKKNHMEESIKELFYDTLIKLQETFPEVKFNTSDANLFLVKQDNIKDSEYENLAGYYSLYHNNIVIIEEYLMMDFFENPISHETIHHAIGYNHDYGRSFEENLVSYVNFYIYNKPYGYLGARYIEMLSVFIPLEDMVRVMTNGNPYELEQLFQVHSNGINDIIEMMDLDYYLVGAHVKIEIINMFFNYLNQNQYSLEETMSLLEKFVKATNFEDEFIENKINLKVREKFNTHLNSLEILQTHDSKNTTDKVKKLNLLIK